MNVTAVSAMAQRSQDFLALQSTLQAGNLPAAQRAFAAFQQDVQKTSVTAGPSSLFGPGTQGGQDLQSLGSALKSANLASAQRAFASLQRDIQAGGQSSGSLPLASVHRPLTHAEVANNGAAIPDAGGASAQAISNILNSKA